MKQPLRLGVNIDHVATIRNARGGADPDPTRAAVAAARAGADGITAHLREDRRHITDDDITRLTNEIDLPLNFEMAATGEMLEIALRHKPHAACLVPEKRKERTTEGGLDVAGAAAAEADDEEGGDERPGNDNDDDVGQVGAPTGVAGLLPLALRRFHRLAVALAHMTLLLWER